MIRIFEMAKCKILGDVKNKTISKTDKTKLYKILRILKKCGQREFLESFKIGNRVHVL